MIPQLDKYTGNLPPGIHEATWEDLEGRYGNTPYRRILLNGLRQAAGALHRVGCARLYVDGSFVTRKRVPSDFDACWDIAGVSWDLLRITEPVLTNFDNARAAQKAKFKGELFPAQLPADLAGTTYFDYFQRDKASGRPKGIILIQL